MRLALPILHWLPGYSRADFRGDLAAGLTVGVMLVPQSMAYALLAGVPAIYGLYASLVPLLVYVVLGSSRHLAVGITALDSLIVVAALSAVASPMSDDFVGLALLLAIMAGAIQLAMGLARFGFVVALLSRPVITGFTAAAAITIGISQVESLLGLTLGGAKDPFSTLYETALSMASVHPPSVVIGAGGIVLLLFLRRFAPRVPAALVAVVLATLAVDVFGLSAGGMRVVGDVPTGLPFPTLPTLDLGAVRQLLPAAITLSLVQFMSVISLGKVFAARHGYRVDPNRELVALGALNLVGALFRSVPVSGSFSRSAVGERAGGQTALANAVAAAVVALTLLFLTPLFRSLPIPVLASIILVAALSMVDVQELRLMLRAKRIDGLIALLTFGATLILGIQNGVIVGIFASVVAIMLRISRPHVAELGRLPGTTVYRSLTRHPSAERIPGLHIVRFDASLGFANADFLGEYLTGQAVADPAVHTVLVDASSVNDLDLTAAAILLETSRRLALNGTRLAFFGVKGPVKDVMDRSGLLDALGPDRSFLDGAAAVEALQAPT